MDDNIADDAKHEEIGALSPQVAFEELEVEAVDIDSASAAVGHKNDDNGPRELV